MSRKFTSDWVSMHIDNWSKWLSYCAGKESIKGLEIGSHEGRASCWFLDNILTGKDSWLTCVDPWTGKYSNDGFYNTFLNNTKGLRVKVIRDFSENALPTLYYQIRRFDFIYIDGCHEAHNLLYDMCMSWTLLKPGCVMIIDDYSWCDESVIMPPKPAIDAWLDIYKHDLDKYEIPTAQYNQAVVWKRR